MENDPGYAQIRLLLLSPLLEGVGLLFFAFIGFEKLQYIALKCLNNRINLYYLFWCLAQKREMV